MKAITAADMKVLDKRTMKEKGVSGKTLMERAGAGAAAEILDFCDGLKPDTRICNIAVLAGKGNNGGDAFVVARILAESRNDLKITVFCTVRDNELSGDTLSVFRELPSEIRKNVRYALNSDDLRNFDLLIDGLLGTGISGQLREPYRSWIRLINESGKPVISIDIPSGLDGDTGEIVTDAVTADLTVTMALVKKGMITAAGPRQCGRIRIVDIGIPHDYIFDIKEFSNVICLPCVRKYLLREHFDIHKNLRGHVLVVGGSMMYPGAPFLSGEAALRTGAGLATVAIPASVKVFGSVAKALIVRPVPDGGTGHFNSESENTLKELILRADAIIAGPGMGTEKDSMASIELILNTKLPLLLDADALNLIAQNPKIIEKMKRRGGIIMTPHPGEMKRLLQGFGLAKHVDAPREKQAEILSVETGNLVVLKGCRTVVAAPDGLTTVNTSGCAALATAGSGDILSGMIAAISAGGQRLSPFESSLIGVYLHGLASELACPCGSRGYIADDLLHFIQKAIRKVSVTA